MYWAQMFDDRIRKADLNGGNVETLLAWPEVDDAVGIALDLPLEAADIPTVSDWGLFAMAAVILAAGAHVVNRRCKLRSRGKGASGTHPAFGSPTR